MAQPHPLVDGPVPLAPESPVVSSPPTDEAPDSRGAVLELAAAHEVVPLVRARGTMFLVTTREGDVAPKGARELGLFNRDTRYLSHYQLVIDGLQTVYLSDEVSGDTINQIDLMLASKDAQAFLDDPSHFVHIRRRQMLDDAFIEQLSFTNYLRRDLVFDVRIRFAADFADIFEVRGAKRERRGNLSKPQIRTNEVEIGYAGLDGAKYSTVLSFDPTPCELEASCARFTVRLSPGERRTIEAIVRPVYGDRPSVPVEEFRFRKHRLDDDAAQFKGACTRFTCDDGALQAALDRARSDLFLLRTTVGDQTIVGAGIPWFCCPFGRDSLLTSYEALTLTPALALESLRTLAAYQGQRHVAFTEEEPGKILHELRFGEMARVHETPHTPYYGSVDATPLFVVVMHAYYETTADLASIRELRAPLLAALGWIDAQTEDASRPVTYERRTERGLDNQAWKDSRDAVVYPTGVRATPPIAIAEVQGYCVDAYARGAHLLQALGEVELAAIYAMRARKMHAMVENAFWMDDLGRFAYAIDGTGARIPTVVSNLGHLLWSRVPSADQARATSELLISPPSFSGFGVRTLASDQPAFNPLSYHNGTVWPHDNAIIACGMSFYGLRSHTMRVFEGILAALETMRDRRLPELFCGMDRSSGGLVRYPVACSPQAWAAAAPFLLLQSVLGLSIDAPNRRVYVREPTLPPSVKQLTIERMRVGDAFVSMGFAQRGRRCDVDVLDIEGGDVRTLIEIG